MRRLFLLIVVVSSVGVSTAQTNADPPQIRIIELVGDPQTDWNQDGKLTPSDEYVELLNDGSSTIDISGWNILFNDTSPTTVVLAGVIVPGDRRLILNPPGELNNNAHVALVNPSGDIVDEIRFGQWPGSALPSADSQNQTDEAMAWVAGQWTRWHATPGTPNGEPRWELASLWTPPPVDGWSSPAATGRLSARVIHAGATIDQIELHRRNNNETLVVATVPTGVEIDVFAKDGLLEWHVPNSAWSAQADRIAVDRIAPKIIAPPAPVWVQPNATWAPLIQDQGAGATEFQWRLSGGNESVWGANVTPQMEWTGPIQIRARDRVGNIGNWSQNVSIAVDATPPAAPALFIAQQFQITWTSAPPEGAPTVAWEVTRLHNTPKAWTLASNTTQLRDDFDPGRLPLAYEVRAHDAAGNVGGSARIDVDHPGLHPHILGIRTSKPWWGKGTLEIRVDFDRRMDAAAQPRMEAGGRIVDEGRWFANATTYYVAFASSEDWDEGATTFRVTDATDAAGSRMIAHASATIVVDRSDPALIPSVGPGWTNESHVRLRIDDVSSAHGDWKLWPAKEKEPTGWNGTFTDSATIEMPSTGDPWILKATAKDAAGNSVTQRWEYRVDRQPPVWTTVEATPGGLDALAVEDHESGLDWQTLRHQNPQGWTIRTDVDRHRVTFEATATAVTDHAAITIRDRAGNQASFQFDLLAPSPATLEARPSDGASDAASRIERLLAAEASAPTEPAPSGTGAWWTAGLLGSSALSIPLARRARRRRRAIPSFAKRVRDARSATSAT